jgi:hypothetical protein
MVFKKIYNRLINKKVSAIPPDHINYTKWKCALQLKGLWDGKGYCGSIKIPENDYNKLVKQLSTVNNY